MKRPAPRDVAFILTGIAGVAVVFLPFVRDIVPLGVLFNAYEPEFGGWRFVVPAAVPLVAVAVLASSIRQAFAGALTKWEVRAAYGLAFAALAATGVVTLAFIVEGPGRGEGAVAFPSVLVGAAGAAIVLAATRNGRVAPHVHAHVAMLVAWMPNAACCLAVLGAAGGWAAGFHLAVVTLAAYVVEAVLRVRRAVRGEGGARGEAGPSSPSS